MKLIPTTLILSLFLTLVSHAQTPGTLDAGFGNNGLISTPVSLKGNGVYGIRIQQQSSGNYLVLFSTGHYDSLSGNYNYTHSLHRFNGSGQADAVFGNNGRIDLSFSASTFYIQPDDKILIFGTSGNEIVLMRCLSNGSPDLSYGHKGMQYTGLFFDPGASLLMKDGSFLIAGIHPTDNRNMIVRLGTDGYRDFNFGTDGIQYYDYDQTSFIRYFSTLKEAENGKVLVGTTLYGVMQNLTFSSVVKLNKQLNYDSTFSLDGEQILNYQGFRVQDLQTTPDGKLMVAGVYFYNNYQSSGIVLSRLKVNGTPDSTFGVKSTRTANFGGISDYSFSLLVQPDGKPVCAGSSDGRLGLLRAGITGNLDNGFNGNGKSTTTLSNTISSGWRFLQMQADGKLMAAGYAYHRDSTGHFILGRYHSGYNTGIRTPESNSALSLYPNPAGNSCTLEFNREAAGPVSISFFNMQGQLLDNRSSITGNAGDLCRETFELQQLSAGVYVLVVQNGQKKEVIKFIRE